MSLRRDTLLRAHSLPDAKKSPQLTRRHRNHHRHTKSTSVPASTSPESMTSSRHSLTSSTSSSRHSLTSATSSSRHSLTSSSTKTLCSSSPASPSKTSSSCDCVAVNVVGDVDERQRMESGSVESVTSRDNRSKHDNGKKTRRRSIFSIPSFRPLRRLSGTGFINSTKKSRSLEASPDATAAPVSRRNKEESESPKKSFFFSHSLSLRNNDSGSSNNRGDKDKVRTRSSRDVSYRSPKNSIAGCSDNPSSDSQQNRHRCSVTSTNDPVAIVETTSIKNGSEAMVSASELVTKSGISEQKSLACCSITQKQKELPTLTHDDIMARARKSLDLSSSPPIATEEHCLTGSHGSMTPCPSPSSKNNNNKDGRRSSAGSQCSSPRNSLECRRSNPIKDDCVNSGDGCSLERSSPVLSKKDLDGKKPSSHEDFEEGSIVRSSALSGKAADGKTADSCFNKDFEEGIIVRSSALSRKDVDGKTPHSCCRRDFEEGSLVRSSALPGKNDGANKITDSCGKTSSDDDQNHTLECNNSNNTSRISISTNNCDTTTVCCSQSSDSEHSHRTNLPEPQEPGDASLSHTKTSPSSPELQKSQQDQRPEARGSKPSRNLSLPIRAQHAFYRGPDATAPAFHQLCDPVATAPAALTRSCNRTENNKDIDAKKVFVQMRSLSETHQNSRNSYNNNHNHRNSSTRSTTPRKFKVYQPKMEMSYQDYVQLLYGSLPDNNNNNDDNDGTSDDESSNDNDSVLFVPLHSGIYSVDSTPCPSLDTTPCGSPSLVDSAPNTPTGGHSKKHKLFSFVTSSPKYRKSPSTSPKKSPLKSLSPRKSSKSYYDPGSLNCQAS